MNSLPTPDEDDPLEELTSQAADEFMERLDRGENPDVEEAAARHPEIGGVLRRLLPALQAMRESESGPRPFVVEPDRLGRLGDFEIVREVGRGGMGVVYEAIQVSLGRRVALKVLPFAAMLDPNRLQRFQNEARAAACLHHSNIVPIFGVGCDRGVHFYAMQYIEGRNLAVLVQDARRQAGLPPDEDGPREDRDGTQTTVYPPAVAPAAPTQADAALSTQRAHGPEVSFHTAARLAVQAAEALHHAHQQGVVHRDVKPANAIVDAAGRLWVTDFGLAQVQSDPRLTTTGGVVGTLRYMSPEQASGDQVVDHRTDVFSLGATLYELLALRPAFGGRDRATVLRRVVQEDPRPLRRIRPSIPADLETIVAKAMAKSPADRYATAQALADDLRRFLEDKPIQAKRPSLLEKAARWSRRRRRLVAAVIGGLILAVCVLTTSTVLIACQMAETRKAYDLLAVQEKATQEEKDNAKTAYQAESKERQRAQEAAWKARQVLNYFSQVSEEEFPDKPELRPLRRELLEAALGYYKDFIEQQGDDPSVQAEMTASKLRIASLLEEMGQKEDALAIYEQLRADMPATPGLPGGFRWLGESEFALSSLLTQPAVQQDLKLTDEQIKAIALHAERRREPRAHRPDDDSEARDKACFEVLRPEQTRRLRQIVWQQRGTHTFTDADMADALELTPDERERIRKIEDDWHRAFWGHFDKHSDDLWKGVSDRLLGVLTEKQKAKWKEMLGAPFRGQIRIGFSPPALPLGFHLPRSPNGHD